MEEDRKWEIADQVAEYLKKTYGNSLPLLLRIDQNKPVLIEAVKNLGLEQEVGTDYYGLMSRLNPRLCEEIKGKQQRVRDYFNVPPEGIKAFLEEYILLKRKDRKPTKHNGLDISADPQDSSFCIFTEEPLYPLTHRSVLWPHDLTRSTADRDHLADLTLFNDSITLNRDNYKEGKPERELMPYFKRVAVLFRIPIVLRNEEV